MTHRLTVTLADEIRAELARKRVLASELAGHLGRSEAYVSRRLSAELPFNVDDLALTAELLDVSIVDLMARATKTSAGRGSGQRSQTQPPSGERNGS
jgi:transcriptional regulator with XRE-family HTH domain